MDIDADAVLWHHSPDRTEDTPLLVLLHGVGSHEGDLFGLVPELPTGMDVASLPAPLRWPNGGRAWFDLAMAEDGSFTYDATQVNDAAAAVLAWLDEHAAEGRRVVLVGFSQGAATALAAACRAPGRISALVMLSGLLPFTDPAGVQGPRDLPAFVAIGLADDVIGQRAIALQGWAEQNLAAEIHHYPIGHWVSGPELADLRTFLARHVG